tara:strand:+ start:333 stop:617 length:285 start_codon:yes stop_codon:yes gene_type:complete
MKAIFARERNYFGAIDRGMYKSVDVGGDCVAEPFSYNFTEAIVELHELVKDWDFKTYPKMKFELYTIDGTDNYGELKITSIYTLTAAKAKKFIL